MPRNELAATLIAVAEAAQAAGPALATVRTRSVTMDLPLEMRWGPGPGGTWLGATLPRWRWQTVFDRKPGRIVLTWDAESRP